MHSSILKSTKSSLPFKSGECLRVTLPWYWKPKTKVSLKYCNLPFINGSNGHQSCCSSHFRILFFFKSFTECFILLQNKCICYKHWCHSQNNTLCWCHMQVSYVYSYWHREEWSSNLYCRNHVVNCFKCILCRWLYIYLNNKLIEHCTHHV